MTDRMLIYGLHAVEAALANPARICHRLHATENGLRRLKRLAARPDLALQTASVRELDRLLGSDAVHQGVALEVEPLPERGIEALGAASRALLLILDQIEDPRNLGAILRSAAALGAAAVVLPGHGSAPLNGACAKAASGALDLLPILQVGNLAQALERLKEQGFWLIGLDASAAAPLEDAPRPALRALVLGGEGRGLRRLTAARCDLLACLPLTPLIASLNVAVAAGIALYLLGDRPAPAPPAVSPA